MSLDQRQPQCPVSPGQALHATLILFWHVPMQMFPFQLHSHRPVTNLTPAGGVTRVLVWGLCFMLEKCEEEVHQHQGPVGSHLTVTC